MDPSSQPRPPGGRRRALRIVGIAAGEATVEDVVLDHTQATARFGPTTADLIFDDKRPGALDLTPTTAAARYGPTAAAAIFPAASPTD